MRNVREVVQGITLAALIASTTLFVPPSVLAPASQLDTTNEIAAPYGVSIIWTDDWRNCGAQVSKNGQGGCTKKSVPNVIYVSTGMSERVESFIIFHEIAHVLQARSQQAMDECEADRFAWEFVPEIADAHGCQTNAK